MCRHVSDERLVPDLLRDSGRSIGEDLDVGEEGSEHTIITLQSLHMTPLVINMCAYELTLPRRLIHASATKNTSKNRKECN
jgi:hypothetical protein